jgi:hypothetical protein
MSKYKEEIDKIVNGDTMYLSSTFPYINNIEFLQELERAYSDLQHYEVASIINDRIKILGAKEEMSKALDSLNNKIRLFKKIREDE